MQSPKIYMQMAKIMGEIEAVPKNSVNSAQGFKYRSIDDIYLMVQKLLAKHGVFTVPTVLDSKVEERNSKSGSVLLYKTLRIKYTFFADDGSYVDAIVDGEGMDSGDKASNKAMSVAHKYTLLQVFCIPTSDDKDPDAHSHDVLPKTNKPKSADEFTSRPQVNPQKVIADLAAGGPSPGDLVITFGKHKGKRIRDLEEGDLNSYAAYLHKSARESGKPLSASAQEFLNAAEQYLTFPQSVGNPSPEDNIAY